MDDVARVTKASRYFHITPPPLYYTQKSAQVKLMPGNQLTSSRPCFLALTPAGGCIPGNLRLHAGPRESAVSVPSATTWATGASRGKGAPAQGHVCDARMSTAVTALFGFKRSLHHASSALWSDPWGVHGA